MNKCIASVDGICRNNIGFGQNAKDIAINVL